MTTRNATGNTRQTLTEFISGFGIEYRWLYANESGVPRIDPDTDWADFTARDSFVAWETLHCLAPHIAAIRSSVWLNDEGEIIIPLSMAEITATSAALGAFWRDFQRRTRYLTTYEDKYTLVGRIATAIYRETIEKFLWHWEGTDAEFSEPSWPTQWTHEFPLALGELIEALGREAALLAAIAGTSRTGDPVSLNLIDLPLHEHLARHGLGLPSTVHECRFTKRLHPQDSYTAAYLAWVLDTVDARDGQNSPRTGAAGRLAHILGASEAIHTTLDAAVETWPLRSPMAVIMAAFIRDVVTPTLRIYGACAAVHIVLDAAKECPQRDYARAAFIRDVVVPTLRYPTEDMPHYTRFASQLRGLHALAQELAGDLRLFSDEAGEREEDSSPLAGPVPWY
ncbi:MAG: hypothetical protein OXI16_03080 [Chloroflexota bacterium]|nr:hypothetical protein [Chloroflexota bacterium]